MRNYYRITAALLIILTVILTISCSSAVSETNDVKEVNEVVKAEDGTVVLAADYRYPQIDNPKKSQVIEKINKKFEDDANGYVDAMIADYTDEALLMYEKGYIDTNYEFSVQADVTYNDGEKASVLKNYYEYAGGAHPVGYMESETYDINIGKKLAAEDILTDMTRGEINEKIRELFSMKIAESPEGFYENAEEILNEQINDEYSDFYITDSKIVFYLNPYVIAPYAAGIIMAEMPLSE